MTDNTENIQMQKTRKTPVILLSFKKLPEENIGSFLYLDVFNYQNSFLENDQRNSIELRQSESDIVDDQGPCETSGNSKARKL